MHVEFRKKKYYLNSRNYKFGFLTIYILKEGLMNS